MPGRDGASSPGDGDEVSDLLQAAVTYASRGWPVLPLHTPHEGACSCGKANCRSIGKHPRLANGLKGASTDEATIRAWWARWPDANVGILTGPESGVVVVDVDSRHGGDITLASLESANSALPPTPESTTGAGRHKLFRHPGRPIRNKVGIKTPSSGQSGLDLRGDGGYIVAPPSLHANGKRYAWVVSPEQGELAEFPDWLLKLAMRDRRTRAHASHAAAYAEPVNEGERNDMLFRMACAFRGGGDDEDAILARLRSVPCEPPLDDEELRQIARSAAHYKQGFRPSDLGNARRLVQRHGTDLRYCKALKTWFFWDGRRWKRDLTGEVDRQAKETITALYGDATREPDSEARSALVKHALRSEAEQRIQAMVILAATESAVAVSPDQLDSDPWLLNVQNGTLNLRTGELLARSREHLITRLAPVTYDPKVSSSTFKEFLEKMVPDAELRDFLARAAGSTLTGVASDEKLFFVHGPTNTGKSTFAEAMKAMLGDYAVTTDFETFLRKHDGGIRNDVARLAGARMVVSLEVEEGKHLAVALIKSLTGGDTVTARFLHREFFEFLPAFKLWLIANHRPTASAEDSALWRRILVIPFTRSLSEQERDESVKRILREDPGVRAAILAWAVKGCLSWQERGLAPPAAVLQATGDYREECDSIGDFITECCVTGPKTMVGAGELYKAYSDWSTANGEKPLSQKTFGRRLTERKFPRRRGSRGRYYREGLGLCDPCERSEPQGDVFSHDVRAREKTPELPSDGSHGSPDDPDDERAGIHEFEGGLDREEAERRARSSH